MPGNISKHNIVCVFTNTVGKRGKIVNHNWSLLGILNDWFAVQMREHQEVLGHNANARHG